MLRLHPAAHGCGKVILLGEHSVVYGLPALAAGLPEGLWLEAQPLDSAQAPTRVTIPDWDLDLSLDADTDHPVARACLEVLTHCDGPVRGWSIQGRSCLPSRAGLGSSAALSVALARLVLGDAARAEEVVEASMAGERIFHGTPSGIDSEVAARGGVLQFARGHDVEPVSLRAPLSLVVAPSGIPRSTAEQVAKVRTRHDRWPSVVRPVLDALGAVTLEGRSALERNDLDGLGELMDIAHALLAGLDVSSPTLDSYCHVARDAGARGAKLTGAGLGGCVVALPPSSGPEPVLEALRGQGSSPFVMEIHS